MARVKASWRLVKGAVLQLKDRRKRTLIESDGEVMLFTLPGKSVVSVYNGDLLQSRVEAIVCCEYCSFTGTGRLVSEIIRLGGKEYKKNRQLKVTDQKGEVQTCRAGAKLLCKYVMHAASVNFSQEDAEDALKNLYDSVFKEADRKKLRSLAIPLIGAGDSGFSADVCARILVATLMTADNQWLLPREIHLVNNQENTTALIIGKLVLQIPNLLQSEGSLSNTPEGSAACSTLQSSDSYAEKINADKKENSEVLESSKHDDTEEHAYERMDSDEKEDFINGSDGYMVLVSSEESTPEELRKKIEVCDPKAEDRHNQADRPLPDTPSST